ncbi:MAG: hypothetical protein IT371_31985 [Deltaproteobacteria bacterium]|nr:hypothetical protein [Deltaproteobacteria bacterium]
MAVHRRKLRNYLLDRRYQLHFTLIMVVVSALLTAGLGYFWYDEMRKASSIVEVKALGSLTDDEVRQVKEDLHEQDKTRLWILVGFGTLLSVVLAGYGIMLTHKVAGPLYKIGRHMQDVRDGKLESLWDLRKGDLLQEFWLVFKDMHTALRTQTEHEAAQLAEAIAAAERQLAQMGPEASGELKRCLDTLRELRDRKLESCRPAATGGQQDA